MDSARQQQMWCGVGYMIRGSSFHKSFRKSRREPYWMQSKKTVSLCYSMSMSDTCKQCSDMSKQGAPV